MILLQGKRDEEKYRVGTRSEEAGERGRPGEAGEWGGEGEERDGGRGEAMGYVHKLLFSGMV